MVKILLLALSAIFLCSGCSSEKQKEIPDALILEMRNDAQDFSNSLRDVLLGEIKNNGLAAAVSVCSDTAQLLTNNLGVERGVLIKRVSFKNRNENNKPDEFETEGLKYFEQLKNDGKLDSLAEYFKLVNENNVDYLRYMKPIVIQAPCLNCHGIKDQIMPEIITLINTKYQYDKAVDYQIDDLRGAISIQKVF